jgi:hypothetical protein
MADDERPGFKIQGTFYPWVGFDDWFLPDCRLARLVTGFTETQLLRGQASSTLVEAAFAAVAFRQASPGLSVEEAARIFDALKPGQIEAVGFKPVKADDADPPDESGSTPSESGELSSDAPPETSPQTSSTDQPGPITSDTAERT